MKLLLLGASGQVGWSLQRSLACIGKCVACARDEADLEDLDGLRKVISSHNPDVIINAAAYTAVDRAERDIERARMINATAVECIASAAKKDSALLVHYSTDYVFGGDASAPYTEVDKASPANVYGMTKLEGEEAIRAIGCDHFIFRTSWVYSQHGNNFLNTILRLAKKRDELSVVCDQKGTPTHADLIADVSAHALHCYRFINRNDRAAYLGTYHLASAGETNWYEYARYILMLAEEKGLELNLRSDDIKKIKSSEYVVEAKRPMNSRLDCAKLEAVFKVELPDWKFHVQRFINELVKTKVAT